MTAHTVQMTLNNVNLCGRHPLAFQTKTTILNIKMKVNIGGTFFGQMRPSKIFWLKWGPAYWVWPGQDYNNECRVLTLSVRARKMNPCQKSNKEEKSEKYDLAKYEV